MINVSEGEKQCNEEKWIFKAVRLGIDETFLSMGILFFIMGMGFGASYSLSDVNCIEFVKTPLWKKLLRTGLGVGIAVGIFTIFQAIQTHLLKGDDLTYFLIGAAIPNFLASFITYGPFLVFCQYIGLVGETKPKEQKNQFMKKKSNVSLV
jgi:hypothetical protein